MAKQFRGTQIRAFPRRFNCYTLFAIIAQFCAMKWHKRKKSLHTIPHNGIAIGTPICWYVVNVLLLKLRPELYQSGQVQPVSFQSQTAHDPHGYTIP